MSIVYEVPQDPQSWLGSIGDAEDHRASAAFTEADDRLEQWLTESRSPKQGDSK